ncbi:MAG TPA: DegT/DnrJ/EryC1/StrS family aminotransferase [Propionibacteriaceae bacterium]|nr:DegT/DnrJ/EryC1/StrS family aminotransferase [Propionibacteriaceae bacterium]
MIPITVVEFGPEVEEQVLGVLRSGMVAQGPKVKELEDRFAAMVGTKHAVAVSNGTISLVAAVQALDLKPGDEVLTSPFTFIATLNAILEAGATATFADISEDDFNVTAETMAARITDRTKVLMPVHLYGQGADMTGIAKLAADKGLHIVEDTAQSHGATVDGRQLGSYGIGSFSFYATKNITTGEGGMLTTNDDAIADTLRVMRNQGMRARYEYVMAGHNYRLTDLQAALAIPQLNHYDEIVAKRRENAAYLTAGLADVPGVITPKVMPGREHVWHQYTLRITPETGTTRERFIEKLTAHGVGNGIYYPKLVFDYETYQGRDDVIISDCPVAKRIATESVSIPVHPKLTQAQIDEIIAAVTESAKG